MENVSKINRVDINTACLALEFNHRIIVTPNSPQSMAKLYLTKANNPEIANAESKGASGKTN